MTALRAERRSLVPLCLGLSGCVLSGCGLSGCGTSTHEARATRPDEQRSEAEATSAPNGQAGEEAGEEAASSGAASGAASLRSTEPPVHPRTSCPTASPAHEVPLYRPGGAIDVAGRTFLYAWHRDGLEEPRTVLVSLDAAGALVETPIEAGFAHPIVIGAATEGLVSLWMPPGGPARMQRVRVAAEVTAERSVAVDLSPGWPSAIASSASTVLVVHRPATAEGALGANELLVLDVSGRVVRHEPSTSAVDVACVGDRCAVARLGADAVEVALVAADGSERSPVRAPIHRTCRELERLEVEGAVLWLVRADPSFAVALVRGVGLVEVDATALPSESGCGETLYAFEHAPWPSLSTRHRDARPLYAWDPEGRRIVALGTLAGDGFERHTGRAFVDGAIEVAYDASAGMMHSPTDARGTRRYFEHHTFDGGEVALWRREGGAWTRNDVRPLVISGVEGTMSHGYAPAVLRNGAHASLALLSEGASETGWIQPYLAPCESSRASVGPR
jgi:hypothetical protein